MLSRVQPREKNGTYLGKVFMFMFHEEDILQHDHRP